MKIFLQLAVAFLACLMFTGNSYSQAGTVDLSFGTDGIVSYDWGGGHDNATDIHVYNNTTILICGTQLDSGFNSTGILQKFLPDGTIDTSWGTDGIVEFQYGESTFPYTLEVQADGSILVSGATYITVADGEFFVSRFNADGTPDLSFNGTGTWIGSYTTFEELAQTMVIQPDGKIVLAGNTYSGGFSQLLFARVNVDGTLDTTFGTNGYTEINASPQDEQINALGILSSGAIIGVGYGFVDNPWFSEFAKMVKLDANGMPDTNFGPNGVIIPDLFSQPSNLWDCTIVNDEVIVVGDMWDDPNRPIVVAKLDENGAAVTSFGTDGISALNIDPVNVGFDIELYEGDNKLYISGTSGQFGIGDRDFLLIRYHPDGTIDDTFNEMGYVKTPIREDWDEALALAFQPDAKIVLAGMSSGFSSGGDNNRILVRYHNDVVLSTGEFNKDGLIIYPNPVTDLLNIKAKETIQSIAITNFLGQVLFNTRVDALTTTLDLNGFAKGTYFIQLGLGDKTISKKIIKQ